MFSVRAFVLLRISYFDHFYFYLSVWQVTVLLYLSTVLAYSTHLCPHFDNWFIIKIICQQKMQNLRWFQLPQGKDMLLFFFMQYKSI